jgi:hypothetical protein
VLFSDKKILVEKDNSKKQMIAALMEEWEYKNPGRLEQSKEARSRFFKSVCKDQGILLNSYEPTTPKFVDNPSFSLDL